MMPHANVIMRSVTTYQEHIRVKSDSTKGLFLTAHRAFPEIEELIVSRPSDEQVYDYLQARINALQARKMSPSTISIYFCHIKQYLHYRGIRLHQTDIKQCLNFPKKQVEELRPLELETFQKILKACSAKREMLYLAQSSSGMRIGEMVQLRKKDIHTDLARLTVKIPTAFTKTGVARTTFFSAEAAKLVIPRLKKIDDFDRVFGNDKDARNNARREAKYIAALQEKIGICDKYETTGRNVITTHSFRAFFITKVNRQDHNLARYFSGQKGYLQQYDRLTDREKLSHYMGFERLLLVSDKTRDKERIRNLESENSKVVEMENKNREFEKMATGFERRAIEAERNTVESERRYKDLDRRFYALEDAVFKSITKQSKRTDNGDASQCTCHNKPTKTQSPDYKPKNGDVN